MKPFLVGFLLGLLLFPVGGFAYFKYGKPPVAVGDTPLPFEAQIVAVPLKARIDREMPQKVPIAADEGAYTEGAAVYQEHCAECHGLPDHPSWLAQAMFPPVPQLFERHGDHVGVSDDEPGETYWKIVHGIRLSGMPAFGRVLKEKEMWQVALLLAHADKVPVSVTEHLKPVPGAR